MREIEDAIRELNTWRSMALTTDGLNEFSRPVMLHLIDVHLAEFEQHKINCASVCQHQFDKAVSILEPLRRKPLSE